MSGDARGSGQPLRGEWIRRATLAAGLAVLACQVAFVVYEHLGPTRYFAWAPNDYVVQYRLAVTVNGRTLPPAGVRSRYHLASHGVWYFPAQHIIDDIQQYERTYGGRDHVRVTLRYRLNGHAQTTWRWSHG